MSTLIDSTGSLLTATISGELSQCDVGHIQALAREEIQRGGKISALFILEDFHGWQRAGEWSDDSFLTKHDKEIARIAVVGDEKWRDMTYAFLAKGFRQAEVEYFLPGEIAKARAWLTETPGKS